MNQANHTTDAPRIDDPLDAQLTEVAATLADLKHDMQAMQYRIRLDDDGAVRDNLRLISDLRNWLKIAFELEAKFNDREQARAGQAAAYTVDFDHARDQIRCRLDRLRRCGPAKCLP
ncbi:hypothetical protein [Thalassovita mediterranea]|jgi:glycine betaine/choline ABC-type transport system substrate-binding protein|uniref:hypothetical protein n=1 Tax=Thalassovita mediterranea TaxID=340021 RepID=UPI00071D57F7|nr:hypothetical protein [Thalassovita mediterranea]